MAWLCGGKPTDGLPGTADWIKRARDRKLAMPKCGDLLEGGWIEAHGLVPLAEEPPLIEQLRLLLPQGAAKTKTTRQRLRLLRVQIRTTKTMQDLH